MKRLWPLAVLPVTAAVAVVVGGLLLAGSAFLPDFYRAELAMVEFTAFIGAVAAASRFARGDYQRRAWTLIGVCSLLILIGDLTLTTGVFSNRPWTPLANGVLTVAANTAAIVGTWMLAHAWRVAGIELPGSRASRVTVGLLALALALAAAGPPAFIELRGLFQGGVSHLANVASCLGDIVSFSLIAPMLLTAVALRGGLLCWPFALLTAALVSWLCVDATITLAPMAGYSDADVKLMLEFFRALACTFGGAAGFAQRLAANAVGEARAAGQVGAGGR
jgi:hypothetical protein